MPNYDVAAEKLIARIEEKHGCCLAAAEDAKRREHTADSARADGLPDIEMQAGARLAAAREAADAAGARALAAEKERDAAAAEVERLERELDPKRVEEAEEEDGPGPSMGDWTLVDHRRETTRVMNRRAIEPVAAPTREPREPRTGKDGYLHHRRLGLVGAVAYWAGGSLALVVTMLVALIVHLDIVEKVRAALPQGPRELKAETEAFICDRLEQGFAETKHCRTEGQRQEHGIGLALVAALRVTRA